MATASKPDPHSNWLTVGEGLLITKSVLEPYVKRVVNDWHQILLTKLKKKGQCVSTSKCNPSASLCPSCKAWFNELRKCHKGDIKKICWNNTDCTKWAKQQGAWEVAKVFMANLGKMKSQVIDETSTDIAGLLNILRFFPDKAFGHPVSRPVRPCIEAVSNDARNPWAHSARQEMTTNEKKKALDSLKLLLGENALTAVAGVGKGLNDLHKLDSDGITDIYISERNNLKFLVQNLPAEVSKLEAEVKALSSTSNCQEQDICQMKSKISDILLSVGNTERMLENIGFENQQQQSDLLLLKKDLGDLDQAVCIQLSNLEKKQEHLESRQDKFEEKLEEVKTQLEEISEKVDSDAVEHAPLESWLPDFQDKVFGRDADIEHVARLIQSDQKPCVVLTGAPGFGKTTVAINFAYKLQECKVLFVSLREMNSIKDVCKVWLAKVGQHPKENEKEELLYWARFLKEKVVFILDNAEDVLQGDKDAFCNLLQELRASNSSCIQFLITSRESFATSTLEVTHVEIKKLDPKEGIKVICSLLPEGSTCGQAETSLTELVDLCGGIPLALRMIGSILEDYADDLTPLIEELKSFPMDTLEDPAFPSYHQSVRAAFECSFQKLEDSLKAKLVRLAVFRGPFTLQAAASILDCQERPVLAGKELKKLTNKSLLTMSDSSKNKYEMHPLIQKYLMDIKREPYCKDIEAATSKFIDYYTSIVIKGHKLFWSKNNFKSTIEMFRNDTLNIENALEMCYQHPEKMQQFFTISVWSVSMYLEMCISLERLNKFLEACSRSAASQNKKGVEMETQCFLGYYEWKKAGDSVKYQALLGNAKMLYEKEEGSISPSQKWLYKHSYGMMLDQKKSYDEAIEVTKEAQQIATSNPDATDLSLTLNQLGIIEKHRKNFDEAEVYFRQSHEKRTEVLGEEHILSIPKHLADLYLQLKNYKEALVLYEKGLDTYKAIDMDKEKQCIYLLKNMGSCCLQLEKGNQSLECFHRAMELAERWLEGDHRVKAQLYFESAKAFNFEGKRSLALEYAKNALQMNERLEIPSWYIKQFIDEIMQEDQTADN